MRVLVLGGTVFVSHAVAAEAVRRGHEVICAARGVSGSIPDGATLVKINRSDPDGLAPLAGQQFDAVIDPATMALDWVRDAARVLGPGAGHWTFVSSINVYTDHATLNGNASGAVHEPLESEEGEEAARHPDAYGAVKVASENVIRDALGDRAFFPRIGLIVGPGDGFDRFGYWPARFSQGGRVIIPSDPGHPAQYIDVRDLADWIVDAAEQRLTGTYDVANVSQPLEELLGEIAKLSAAEGTELVPVDGEVLYEKGRVWPWTGPRSLPMWLPPNLYGGAARDTSFALADGLKIRPLADTVAAALEHERALGLDRERKAGLTLAEEREVLAVAGC